MKHFKYFILSSYSDRVTGSRVSMFFADVAGHLVLLTRTVGRNSGGAGLVFHDTLSHNIASLDKILYCQEGANSMS